MAFSSRLILRNGTRKKHKINKKNDAQIKKTDHFNSYGAGEKITEQLQTDAIANAMIMNGTPSLRMLYLGIIV
jgi:hypothetical protein